jgi:hypothetical protein
MGLYTLFAAIWERFVKFWRYIFGRQIKPAEETPGKKKRGGKNQSKANLTGSPSNKNISQAAGSQTPSKVNTSDKQENPIKQTKSHADVSKSGLGINPTLDDVFNSAGTL